MSLEHWVEPLTEATGMRQKAMASRVAERSWRELSGESQLRGKALWEQNALSSRKSPHDGGHEENLELGVY